MLGTGTGPNVIVGQFAAVDLVTVLAARDKKMKELRTPRLIGLKPKMDNCMVFF